jgi:hypothetical protein
MRRAGKYRLWLATGLVATIIGVIALFVLRHEPHFYRIREIEPGAERHERSSKLFNDFTQFVLNFAFDPDGWHGEFSEVEVNSFLQEDFINWGEAANLCRLGVSDPRVAFDGERIRMAFRVGSGFWSTIVSYDLRVWAVPREPNVLAVQVLGRRIGALPISTQSVVTDLADLAARHNAEMRIGGQAGGKLPNWAQAQQRLGTVEVTPYRYEGCPVALIRFQADQAQVNLQLKCLRVEPGMLKVGGRCTRDVAPVAANPLPALN